MPENSNEERREILAYMTEEPPSEQYSEGRYFLRYERNMTLDRLEEPSANPQVGSGAELSKDEFYQLEDRLGYQGVGSGSRRKETTVYGMRTTIDPGGEGMDAVDWVGAEPSVLDQHGLQNNWDQTAAGQDKLRLEAIEYDQRGVLPQGWTPASARVGGNRPGVDAWKDIRDERWPVGEDGRRRPADQQADAPQDAQRQEQSMGNVKGSNSQAGLAAHVGGARMSLPSTPKLGEPGSRFNPIVREHHSAAPTGQTRASRAVTEMGRNVASQPRKGGVGDGPRLSSERNSDAPGNTGDRSDPSPNAGPAFGMASSGAARGSSNRSEGVAQQFASGFSNGVQAGLAGGAPDTGTAAKAASALSKGSPRAGKSSMLSDWIQDEATREQEDMITEVPEEIKNPKPAVEIKKSGPGSEPREPHVSKTGIRLAPGAQEGGDGPEHEAGR